MIEVRAATSGDIDACAQVLAEAFQDDPGTMVFLPDATRRAEILPSFFRTFVAAALSEQADLMVTGDPVAGVASWFGPERHEPSPDAMARHGLGDVLERCGPEATQRLGRMLAAIESQHEELIHAPHLRLEFFGVTPAAQGTGIGSALLEPGHRRADDLGLPTYLETFTQPNVRFYERRGYQVVGEFAIDDGVPGWCMVRPPGAK